MMFCTAYSDNSGVLSYFIFIHFKLAFILKNHIENLFLVVAPVKVFLVYGILDKDQRRADYDKCQYKLKSQKDI